MYSSLPVLSVAVLPAGQDSAKFINMLSLSKYLSLVNKLSWLIYLIKYLFQTSGLIVSAMTLVKKSMG